MRHSALTLLLLLMLCACGDDHYVTPRLVNIDRNRLANPDSVVQQLQNMTEKKQLHTARDSMFWTLLYAEAMTCRGYQMPNENGINYLINYYRIQEKLPEREARALIVRGRFRCMRQIYVDALHDALDAQKLCPRRNTAMQLQIHELIGDICLESYCFPEAVQQYSAALSKAGDYKYQQVNLRNKLKSIDTKQQEALAMEKNFNQYAEVKARLMNANAVRNNLSIGQSHQRRAQVVQAVLIIATIFLLFFVLVVILAVRYQRRRDAKAKSESTE